MNDFRLIPGELENPYCFTNFQQLNLDIIGAASVISNTGSVFYNLGNTEPVPDKRGFPWFDTNDGNWYSWNINVGLWTRENPVPPASESRILWVGTTTSLQSYDGGDANPPGAASGPMWEVDTNFAAKFPVGPGTFSNSVIVAVGGTGGLPENILTDVQLAAHVHDIVNKVVVIDDVGAGQRAFNATGSPQPATPATVTTQTDPSGGGGAVQPVPNLPPYLGTYVIKRTARIWMVAP